MDSGSGGTVRASVTTYSSIAVLVFLIAFAGCADPSPQQGRAAGGNPKGDSAEPQVMVYYFHRTFRCFSCTRMEALVRASLQEAFPDELEDGTVAWKRVNYQQNEQFAQQYGVVGPSVVVSPTADAGEARFETLNQLWTMVDDPEMVAEELRCAVVRAMK